MDNKIQPLDALGNEIVMGKSYAYTTGGSGITRVVSGIADSVTKTGKISLVVTKVVQYVYGKNPKPVEYDARTVSVYGCNLFLIEPR